MRSDRQSGYGCGQAKYFPQAGRSVSDHSLQLNAEMNGRSILSDRNFLLSNAKDFRDLAALAAARGEDDVRDELLRMPADCEEKAAQEG